jgi:hypothetical protein
MKVSRIITLILILAIVLIIHFVKYADDDSSQQKVRTHNGYPY